MVGIALLIKLRIKLTPLYYLPTFTVSLNFLVPLVNYDGEFDDGETRNT